MIKAVANFFAGVIGVFIALAIISIGTGAKIAMDANTDQEGLAMGAAMVILGLVILFLLGRACVLLDIMFNVRKISETRCSEQHKSGKNVTRAEPELG